MPRIQYGEDLIRIYNRLIGVMVSGQIRPNYGRRRGGYVRLTQERLREAQDLLDWMGEHSFLPLSYLCGAFGSHNWCYQPKWDRLREKRYQAAYESGDAWRLTVTALWQEPAESGAVLHTHELFKGRCEREGKSAICRIEHALSGGFNAASEICIRCPERAPCAAAR
jgi:hypothetical protein